jgi:hypothetical protein
MAARKLLVEVVAAKALMPKDGQGSTNAYCVVSLIFVPMEWSVVSSFLSCLLNFMVCVKLDYDGQRKRTRVKPKDLDPVWNEKVCNWW